MSNSVSRKPTELKVIDDLYGLILWTNERIQRFPKQTRYTVGQKVETELIDVLGLLINAKLSRKKVEALDMASVGLEKSRFWFRLAMDTQSISRNGHQYASSNIVMIGKQVSAWCKHSKLRE